MTVGSVSSSPVAATPVKTTPVQSDVQKLLAKSTASKTASKESYTEQDWYLSAKVAQLKGQINTYSNLPGLDSSGAVMESLTQEVNALVMKQQEKLKAKQAEAAAQQKILDDAAIKKAKDETTPTVDMLLKRAKDRANGIKVEDYVAPVAQTSDNKKKNATASGVYTADQLLERSAKASDRGTSVNTTA